MTTDIIVLQIVFAISMYLSCLVSYLCPLRFLKKPRKKSQAGEMDNSASRELSNGDNGPSSKILSQCNCFSAGLFLSICFLQLMPMVSEEFALYFKAAQLADVKFPFAEFTVMLGFFLILFLEHLVMVCKSQNDPPILHLDDFSEQSHHLLEDMAREDREPIIAVDNSSIAGNHSTKPLPKAEKMEQEFHQKHHHGHSHIDVPSKIDNTLTFFILMIATGVHSIFEGLALGLQSDFVKAVHLFIGIISHECLVSFALGVNSARADVPLKTNIKFGLFFCSTVPLGIILGIALGYTPGILGRFISAVMQGLAAGTFLHVSFNELIPSELMDDDISNRASTSKLYKIILIFIGFITMALLTYFTEEN